MFIHFTMRNKFGFNADFIVLQLFGRNVITLLSFCNGGRIHMLFKDPMKAINHALAFGYGRG